MGKRSGRGPAETTRRGHLLLCGLLWETESSHSVPTKAHGVEISGRGVGGSHLALPCLLSLASCRPPCLVLPTARQSSRKHRKRRQSFLPLSAAVPFAAGPSSPLCIAKPGRPLETQTHMGRGEGERCYDRGN